MELSRNLTKRIQALAAAEIMLDENPDPAMAAYIASKKRALLAKHTVGGRVTNRERMTRAKASLANYGYDTQENVVQLLVDIKMFCQKKGVDFNEALRVVNEWV